MVLPTSFAFLPSHHFAPYLSFLVSYREHWEKRDVARLSQQERVIFLVIWF